MLIEFKVANYRSIAKEQILSLIPDKRKSDFTSNIMLNGKHKALNAIALYGANASGKSNLLLSMSLLDKLINLSGASSSTTKLPYDPFLLQEGWQKRPTYFEITFIIDEVRYRYGLEYHQDRVTSEWLYRKTAGREVNVFLREDEIIDTSSALKGNTRVIDAAIESTRPNALFLSMCDNFNIKEAKTIFQWFRKFQMIDGLNIETIGTVHMWEDADYREKIRTYMSKLDLGLADVDVITKNFDTSELPDSLSDGMKSQLTKQLSGAKSFDIIAKHKFFSQEGAVTDELLSWKFAERESAGTNKAFQLSGPVLWTLTNGGVLIIDEIEAKLHPIMTLETINLFLDKQTNPNNAQLIFATHNTNLLTYSELRRDQIYFCEKNTREATEIYSLSDFVYLDDSKERPDTDKEKRYIEGRYGAVPVLSDFHSLKLIPNGEKR